jgi:hypothetical protein
MVEDVLWARAGVPYDRRDNSLAGALHVAMLGRVVASGRRCGRATSPASACSSITPAPRSRWSTPRLARRGRRSCSSPRLARRATSTLRAPGRRACPTGSARIRAPFEPPALRRLDAGAPHQAAIWRDRPPHLSAGRDHPPRAQPPRAGLPRLRRHPAAGRGLRPRGARGRLQPRRRQFAQPRPAAPTLQSPTAQ